jgi:hypothetical protein
MKPRLALMPVQNLCYSWPLRAAHVWEAWDLSRTPCRVAEAARWRQCADRQSHGLATGRGSGSLIWLTDLPKNRMVTQCFLFPFRPLSLLLAALTK